MDGFYDGVQYYNSKHGTHVQVLGWNESTQNGSFTGNFTDQTAGQTLTQTFITEGADIIFPVAGNVGLGAAKAVQNADAAAGSQKVNMMWVDTDGCISAAQYCKYFITSVTKGIQPAVKNAVLHGRQRQLQGRQLHRHAGQRRRRAGAVPRLRQQGPGQPAVRAGRDQGSRSSPGRSVPDEGPGFVGQAEAGVSPARGQGSRAGYSCQNGTVEIRQAGGQAR